jgi:hypothetical protein
VLVLLDTPPFFFYHRRPNGNDLGAPRAQTKKQPLDPVSLFDRSVLCSLNLSLRLFYLNLDINLYLYLYLNLNLNLHLHL